MKIKPLTFTLVTDEGDEEEHDLPTKREVCHRCNGEGTHVNPSIDSHGISAEEWANDWDEDEREGYMSGRYDVTCYECDGRNVVDVVDEDRFEKENPELYKAWLDYQNEESAYRAECAAERAMGA